MPTLAYILAGTPKSGRLMKRNRKNKQISGPSALLDVGRRAETLSRKHRLFQIQRRILRCVDIYQKDFRAKNWATILVLGMCELSLKGEH
jgi:hypothetical protein